MSKELDKLIEQVLIGAREQIEEEKGGVSSEKESEKSTSNLGLDLAELISIIGTGTETETILKSSRAALQTLMANANIVIDYTSAETLAESFRFFDYELATYQSEKCSDLGSLMSKFALAAGLIAIKEQFNNSAAGFVNEAFIAELMKGQSVPAGSSGVEDIMVMQNGKRVGISLKFKASEILGGSFSQLLETLSIPYYKDYKSSQTAGVRTIRRDTDVRSETLSPRRSRVFVKPNEDPINDGGLYYLAFEKRGDKLAVAAYKITPEDIIGSASSEDGFYNINKLNNILKQKPPQTADSAVFTFEGDYSPEMFNSVMQREMSEVLESLKLLDAWYGGLKGKMMSYISSLEKSDYTHLQTHLAAGADFTFKAFNISSCGDDTLQESAQQTKPQPSLNHLIDTITKQLLLK